MYTEQLAELEKNIDVRANLISIKSLLKTQSDIAAFKLEEGYNTSLFMKLLDNEDAKTRKNAALIMGILRESEFEQALLKAYRKEKTLFVKDAYLTALLSYDYTKYKDFLFAKKRELETGSYDDSEIKHIAAQLKVLKKMFPDKLGHERHTFHAPEQAVKVILTCKKEMAAELLEQVDALSDSENAQIIFCGVSVDTTRIYDLASIRTYKELLFSINNMRPMDKSELPGEIVRGNLINILGFMHNQSSNPYFFRLSGKDIDVSELAGKIEAMSGGKLVNSVSDYEVEIRLIKGRSGKYGAFLKLFTLKDHRFDYRKNYVAASIHPVNAASIAYLAKGYMKEDAQILDPFCGVGTMLIERNKMVPAKHIYGIDTFGKAIDGARENTKSAGIIVNYINKNYFDFEHDYLFDEIITNMPVFSDRGAANDFYRSFFEKSQTVLTDGGIIIMYSDEKNIIKKYLRLKENYRLLREFVFNEKEGYSVFIIECMTEVH